MVSSEYEILKIKYDALAKENERLKAEVERLHQAWGSRIQTSSMNCTASARSRRC